MKSIFTKEALETFLCPFGYKAKVSNMSSEEDIFDAYSVVFTGINQNKNQVSIETAFSIPKVDDKYERIMQVEGSSGTRHRICGHTAHYSLIQENELHVVHWKLCIMNALNTVISSSLMETHFDGSVPFDDNVEQKIQNWFNTCPNIFDVDIRKKNKILSYMQSVTLDIKDEIMSHNARIFNPNWIGKLDPTSTPTSEKVNLVYRLVQGAYIKNGTIMGTNNRFCDLTAKSAIALKYNPRRAYLIRTTIENSEELYSPEVPVINPESSELISGVHLKTAIMHLGLYTHQDAIAISKSAATKLASNNYKSITFKSRNEITMKVKEGDVVEPKQLLATTPEAINCIATKIVQTSVIAKIDQYKVMYNGYLHNAVRFTLVSIYSLNNGDKISNRGATKGIVNIVDDELMPKTDDGQTIEVCIAPESVIGRRVLAIYWEMMAHKYLKQNPNAKITNVSYDPDVSFNDLVNMGYGKKEHLYLTQKLGSCEKLPDSTFVGDIYWLRLNKHANEMISVTGSKRLVSKLGTLIDDPRISGQRIDVSKMMALNDRNLGDVIDHVIQENKYGDKIIRKYIESLI